MWTHVHVLVSMAVCTCVPDFGDGCGCERPPLWWPSVLIAAAMVAYEARQLLHSTSSVDVHPCTAAVPAAHHLSCWEFYGCCPMAASSLSLHAVTNI